MTNNLYERDLLAHERHNTAAALFREFILGGQDGLVNVLGIILGLAVATQDSHIVIIAGIAAMFAESISMGAVAFTSRKSEIDYYHSQEKVEEHEIETIPEVERKEVRAIYYKKGFRGKLLDEIVKTITSDKKRWLDIMMKEELGLSKDFLSPLKSAAVVLLAALIGSLIPLIPFFLLPIHSAVMYSLIVSALALFITGATEAKLTVGNWVMKGLQLMIIGMAAAGVGFLVGKFSGYSG